MPTTQTKIHEMEVEVEITDGDVYDHLMSAAFDLLGEKAPMGDPSTCGPHVFQEGESRWYWGKSLRAAQYIRAAHMLKGYGDPEVEVSRWALLDQTNRVIVSYRAREHTLDDKEEFNREVAALDPGGNPIIRTDK